MINSEQKVPGASSIDSPAATTNGDNYVLVWTTSDQSVWWTKCPASSGQNSYDWVKPASIPNAASSGGPALAEFAGKAWMAWKGEGTDPRIFISSLSGSTWSSGVPISGVGASSSPALTATASELYLAWKDEKDNTIYWSKSSDGKAWSPQEKVPGAASSDAPALAAFKDAVYLAWKGESDAAIWFSEYTEAKGWGTAKSLPSDFETSRGPALGAGNTGNLHVVWKGKSNNFVWESVRETGKTDWSPRARIVTIETDARPALGSQTSSATDIMLAWKGGATTDVWAAPLDNLHKLYPMAPERVTAASLTWDFPAGATAPASLSGAQYNIGFGSGPTQAAVASSLVLSDDGKANYSGWYQNQGHIPIFDAPSQTYHAVIVVAAANKVIYTFTRSNNQGVPTGGAVDTWDVPQTAESIAKNWANLQPPRAKTGPQAALHFSCTNNADLLSFVGEIIQDIEKVLGWVEEAVEVISVIAS